jgi:hypothetical protein
MNNELPYEKYDDWPMDAAALPNDTTHRISPVTSL